MTPAGHIRIVLFSFSLLAAGSTVWASPPPDSDSSAYRLPLSELFRLAHENSLRLKASHIREEAAAEQVKTARSERLPSANLSAAAGYIGQPILFGSGLTRPTRPDAPDWSQNYGVQVSQPIYQGGRLTRNIRRSAIEQELARLASTDDEAALKMELLRYYMDLFCLYKQREVLERNIEESELRQKDIGNMLREGLVTRNDEIRSSLQLTQDRLAYRTAEDDITLTSLRLDILLGLDETLRIVPDTALLYEALTPLTSAEDYVESAYDQYPGLLIARQQTRLAQTDLKLMQANYLPSLNLVADNTLARPLTSTMQDRFSNNWNVGLSLTFNLSALYKNRHNVRGKRHDVLLRQNAEEQLMQDLRIGVHEAYVRHREAQDRVGTLQLAVDQAEENYRIVRNRYMNRLSILTDLLDANNVLLDARLQLTAARTDAVFTYYQLMRTCGRL